MSPFCRGNLLLHVGQVPHSVEAWDPLNQVCAYKIGTPNPPRFWFFGRIEIQCLATIGNYRDNREKLSQESSSSFHLNLGISGKLHFSRPCFATTAWARQPQTADHQADRWDAQSTTMGISSWIALVFYLNMLPGCHWQSNHFVQNNLPQKALTGHHLYEMCFPVEGPSNEKNVRVQMPLGLIPANSKFTDPCIENAYCFRCFSRLVGLANRESATLKLKKVPGIGISSHWVLAAGRPGPKSDLSGSLACWSTFLWLRGPCSRDLHSGGDGVFFNLECRWWPCPLVLGCFFLFVCFFLADYPIPDNVLKVQITQNPCTNWTQNIGELILCVHCD